MIVHAISGPSCSSGEVVYSGAPGDAERWKRFFEQHPFLGIHYIIDREGAVASSTPETQQANHALGFNEGSIGIELVHNGDGVEPFSEQQIASLVRTVRAIMQRWSITADKIKMHSEIDSRVFLCGGRLVKLKSDPGLNFPMSHFRAELTGVQSERRQGALQSLSRSLGPGSRRR